MKITDVETYVVGNPWKIWVFVRVLTDAGIYGVGEGTLGHLSQAVEGAIADIKPWVIGVDPFDIEYIVSTVSRDIYADGGQIKTMRTGGHRDRLLGHHRQGHRAAGV